MRLFDFFHKGKKSSEEQYMSQMMDASGNTDVNGDALSSSGEKASEGSQETLILSFTLSAQLAEVVDQRFVKSYAASASVVVDSEALDDLAHQLIYNDEFRAQHIPNMPTILPRLMEAMRNDATSKEEYAQLIGQDPILAASVLKAAQSSLYNPLGKSVDSFERAVVIVGLAGIKVITCSLLLKSVAYSSKETIVARVFWPYMVATAYASQMMAKEEGNKGPGSHEFLAYLAGLFHCIGHVVFVEQLSLSQDFSLDNLSLHYLQQQYIERLTLATLKDWELPEEVIDLVREAAVSPTVSGLVVNSLEKSIFLSKLSHLVSEDEIEAEELENLLQQLGMDHAALLRFISEVKQRVSA